MSPPEAWGQEHWMTVSSTMLFVAERVHRGGSEGDLRPHQGVAMHALGCGWHLGGHSCPSPTRSNLGTDGGTGRAA